MANSEAIKQNSSRVEDDSHTNSSNAPEQNKAISRAVIGNIKEDSNDSKVIDRIVIFYSDKSFSEYITE